MDTFLETITGLKIWSILAAWLGSAISLSYMPRLSPVKMLTTLASGGLIALYAARGMRLYFKDLPDDAEIVIAFFLGLFAMPLMPVVMEKAQASIRALRVPGTTDTKE